MFSIRSCSSNRELKIIFASDSYLLVELAGFPVSATVEVWPEPVTQLDFKLFLLMLENKVELGVVGGSGSRSKEISNCPQPVLRWAMSFSMSSSIGCRAHLKNGPSPPASTTSWASLNAWLEDLTLDDATA
jgi:hypothetical protein